MLRISLGLFETQSRLIWLSIGLLNKDLFSSEKKARDKYLQGVAFSKELAEQIEISYFVDEPVHISDDLLSWKETILFVAAESFEWKIYKYLIAFQQL